MKQTQPARIEDARDWTPLLHRYREPDHLRSMLEILITAVPFIVLWVLMWASLSLSYWLSLVIAVPAAGFLVRLFMIQHDCGHGTFFRHRWVNNWLGRAIGVLTLTPYDHWRRSHAIHHASSGNLERRGIGDINTLTVREYLRLSRWRRLGYRLYRNPIVMFGIGPAFLFLVQHRLPIGEMHSGWRPWLTTMATNAATALLVVTAMWLHVHHLCSRIPYYRLPSVLRDHPELRNAGRLTLVQSFACVRLALWDETRRRLISFRELRTYLRMPV